MSAATETYYPQGGFYFAVTVLGSATAVAALTSVDASFQEVSGIKAEFDVESVPEGGENRFVHKLPKPAKYSNLVMKRGVMAANSFLAEWVGETIGSSLAVPVIPQNLMLTLMNGEGTPTVVWTFVNAYPFRWEISPMNSMENKILTETLEFSYNYFERLNLGVAGVATKLAQLAARFAR